MRKLRRLPEPMRLAAVLEAEREHRGEPELAEAMGIYVRVMSREGYFGDSLVHAVRIFASHRSPELDEEQLELLSSARWQIAAAAALGLAEQRLPEALEPILALADRPAYRARYSFRHIVVNSVGRFRDPRAVEFLIGVLERSSGQLKYEAALNLTLLTGERFGGHAGKWRGWWQGRGERFRFPEKLALDGEQLTELPWPEPLPTLFGLPIHGERVLFLIDRSRIGSPWSRDLARLQKVQRELERVVRRLNRRTRFNVVAYDTGIHPWRGSLVKATLAARTDAVRFVRSLTPGGRADMYRALSYAIEQGPDLEAIYLITAASSTAGRAIDADQLVERLSAGNMFRRVAINVVGVHPDEQGVALLLKLANRNWGLYSILH